MFLRKSIFLVTCLYISLCESFSVESLMKCSLKDSECQKNVYQNMIRDISKTGIEEFGIPPVDPVILKNVAVSLMNLVNLTMVDGVAKGIGNCIFERFEINVEKEKMYQEVTCDLLIKGHYSLSANSPLVKDLLGDGSLTGDGNGKVKLEKLHMSIAFPFYFEKHDDGEIYMKCIYKDIVYEYDIKGKATFGANNIMLGDENISDFVTKYLNENWKVLMKTFGKVFIDKALEFYFDFGEKFFESVPAKYYILEDLTPYVKN